MGSGSTHQIQLREEDPEPEVEVQDRAHHVHPGHDQHHVTQKRRHLHGNGAFATRALDDGVSAATTHAEVDVHHETVLTLWGGGLVPRGPAPGRGDSPTACGDSPTAGPAHVDAHRATPSHVTPQDLGDHGPREALNGNKGVVLLRAEVW